MLNIGLIGNPNCGKTTLFNHLTGSIEKTGNWSGVTVKEVSKISAVEEKNVCFIDCPGIYSLTQLANGISADIQLTIDQLVSSKFDLIINVIDASNLARSLYLTSQLLEAGFKVIVVANMMDLAEKKGLKIDIKKLASELECPVIAMNAHKPHKDRGMKILFSTLSEYKNISLGKSFVKYSKSIQDLIDRMISDSGLSFGKNITKRSQALWWLEGDCADDLDEISSYKQQLGTEFSEDIDILIADERYGAIDRIISGCQLKLQKSNKVVEFLDSITMHKYFGVPLFFLVMYIVLVLATNIGGLFQDFFDSIISIYYINNLQYILNKLHAPVILTSILTTGIGQGINTILSFIPVIGSIFLLLSFLEDSGYMARATFVLNRIMVSLGLPSKAFIPLIIGFGCNVPGIMATRGIDNFHDKLVTIMMSPFLSCSARLAVYTVFASVFFQHGGHNVIFLLYIIGVCCALLTGYLLRRYIVTDSQSQIFYEMPSYRMPSFKFIWRHSYHRVRNFVNQAGKYILYICIVLSVINEPEFGWLLGYTGESILVVVSKFLTPLFSPMGLTADNWQVTVSLLTGILAKEAILGTLNTLYAQATPEVLEFVGASGVLEIMENLWFRICNIPGAIFTFTLVGDDSNLSFSTRESLAGAFHSYREVFAYLLFVSLYLPCLSTAVVISKELNKAWMIFSILWSTILGYGLAVIFYQATTFYTHPVQSISYIIWTMTAFVSCWVFLKLGATNKNTLANI